LLTGVGVFAYVKNHPQIVSNTNTAAVPSPESQKGDENPTLVIQSDAPEAVKSNPPKHASKGSTRSSVSTSAGKATVVSEGTISPEDINTLQKYAGEGPVSNIYYNDTTGNYPALGETIKSYLKNSLLWSGSDISYMYELRIVDCSNCGYGGLYTGSYISNSDGKITKAFGWITLNVYSYKSSPYFADYMKLVFSHEYGHHYTLYHRWVDNNIPTGERWPSQYYSSRPLSLSSTAPDYSLGWGNCDVEIVAEDYSYLFSGYGYHAMSGTYGYPSGWVKTWLSGMSSAPPEEDTTPPSVAISSPQDGSNVSAVTSIVINASDNIAVTRVEIYVDGAKTATIMSAPYSWAWETRSYSNGTHAIKAKAFDSNQSVEVSESVNVNNAETDSEKPVVTISDPLSSPVNWTEDNLHILASATDNVAVVKMEIYVNDSLVASEDSSSIERIWLRSGTPNGSYNLVIKAYDPVGNVGTSTMIVNKS
jgi:hypothetical protein